MGAENETGKLESLAIRFMFGIYPAMYYLFTGKELAGFDKEQPRPGVEWSDFGKRVASQIIYAMIAYGYVVATNSAALHFFGAAGLSVTTNLFAGAVGLYFLTLYLNKVQRFSKGMHWTANLVFTGGLGYLLYNLGKTFFGAGFHGAQSLVMTDPSSTMAIVATVLSVALTTILTAYFVFNLDSIRRTWKKGAFEARVALIKQQHRTSSSTQTNDNTSVLGQFLGWINAAWNVVQVLVTGSIGDAGMLQQINSGGLALASSGLATRPAGATVIANRRKIWALIKANKRYDLLVFTAALGIVLNIIILEPLQHLVQVSQAMSPFMVTLLVSSGVAMLLVGALRAFRPHGFSENLGYSIFNRNGALLVGSLLMLGAGTGLSYLPVFDAATAHLMLAGVLGLGGAVALSAVLGWVADNLHMDRRARKFSNGDEHHTDNFSILADKATTGLIFAVPALTLPFALSHFGFSLPFVGELSTPIMGAMIGAGWMVMAAFTVALFSFDSVEKDMAQLDAQLKKTDYSLVETDLTDEQIETAVNAVIKARSERTTNDRDKPAISCSTSPVYWTICMTTALVGMMGFKGSVEDVVDHAQPWTQNHIDPMLAKMGIQTNSLHDLMFLCIALSVVGMGIGWAGVNPAEQFGKYAGAFDETVKGPMLDDASRAASHCSQFVESLGLVGKPHTL